MVEPSESLQVWGMLEVRDKPRCYLLNCLHYVGILFTAVENLFKVDESKE